jgi:hypothetical protein
LVIGFLAVVLGLELNGELHGAIVPAVPAELKAAAICGMIINFLPLAILFVNIWLKLAPAAIFKTWNERKSLYLTTFVGCFDKYIDSA